METPNYVQGVDSAIVLKAGTTDEAVVKGLTKLGLPELSRQTSEVDQFRSDFSVTLVGGGKVGTITFEGNMVLGDVKGQDLLKKYLRTKEKFTDCRCYLNMNDFLTVDLANDPNTGMQVSSFKPGAAGKNDVYTISGEIALNGLFAYFVHHMTASTLAFVATGKTITDSGSGFVTAGFAAGQSLIVEGTTKNDGQYLIKSVAAGVITLEDSAVLQDESAATAVTLHGGTL